MRKYQRITHQTTHVSYLCISEEGHTAVQRVDRQVSGLRVLKVYDQVLCLRVDVERVWPTMHSLHAKRLIEASVYFNALRFIKHCDHWIHIHSQIFAAQAVDYSLISISAVSRMLARYVRLRAH